MRVETISSLAFRLTPNAIYFLAVGMVPSSVTAQAARNLSRKTHARRPDGSRRDAGSRPDGSRRDAGSRPDGSRRDAGRNRQGYVLLVVIAASILVVTVLSTVAQQSLRRGIEAVDAERSFQQRWGSRTLERAMLANAAKVFDLREELATELSPGKPPPPVIHAQLVLGKNRYDLLLGDEDSKLNLNTLYHYNGPQKISRTLSKVAGPTVNMATRLIPAVAPAKIAREQTKMSLTAQDDDRDNEESDEDEQEPPIPDAFRSWGEVFDLPALDMALGSPNALPAATTGITCWGSGQLNFRRASDEAILAVAASVVQDGGARRILQRYRKNPKASLSALLLTEVSTQPNRDKLNELLSETSTNFSIWIDASSSSGDSIQSFSVMRRDEEGATRQSRFVH